MLCEKCGKNPATVMYTQIINGHKETLNICSSCASAESIFDNFGSLFGFSDHKIPTARTCPICKTTLAEFTRSGRAGCGQCYDAFRDHASAMLKKIHGTSVHNTQNEASHKQNPVKKEEAQSPSNELSRLKAELSELIANENFEEAAVLRDKIRAIEKEGTSND